MPQFIYVSISLHRTASGTSVVCISLFRTGRCNYVVLIIFIIVLCAHRRSTIVTVAVKILIDVLYFTCLRADVALCIANTGPLVDFSVATLCAAAFIFLNVRFSIGIGVPFQLTLVIVCILFTVWLLANLANRLALAGCIATGTLGVFVSLPTVCTIVRPFCSRMLTHRDSTQIAVMIVVIIGMRSGFTITTSVAFTIMNVSITILHPIIPIMPVCFNFISLIAISASGTSISRVTVCRTRRSGYLSVILVP